MSTTNIIEIDLSASSSTHMDSLLISANQVLKFRLPVSKRVFASCNDPPVRRIMQKEFLSQSHEVQTRAVRDCCET